MPADFLCVWVKDLFPFSFASTSHLSPPHQHNKLPTTLCFVSRASNIIPPFQRLYLQTTSPKRATPAEHTMYSKLAQLEDEFDRAKLETSEFAPFSSGLPISKKLYV